MQDRGVNAIIAGLNSACGLRVPLGRYCPIVLITLASLLISLSKTSLSVTSAELKRGDEG
jgi:hypothetical protein